ncbi:MULTISPECIES: hypothetical protein [Grimontia]|uniref:Uncharacterized protein n=1 Tax=Grimontia marina TaxID=646534 RepID=A0A128FHJ9_9GAMM|nr:MULTISPECIES: hypothetical protein [Grimontia]WRV99903.1 hypothetical protein VP504_23245 [Grimontia sp. NTOU-MAR1]CZF85731.1 hypothetical protein GMA8713_03764 [Grimontia marina]
MNIGRLPVWWFIIIGVASNLFAEWVLSRFGFQYDIFNEGFHLGKLLIDSGVFIAFFILLSLVYFKKTATEKHHHD